MKLWHEILTLHPAYIFFLLPYLLLFRFLDWVAQGRARELPVRDGVVFSALFWLGVFLFSLYQCVLK